MNRQQLHVPSQLSALASDILAKILGSWKFVLFQSILITVWISINASGISSMDRPPFVLLNLIFSIQAAYASPIILMSQNRQADRDRKRDDLESEEISELYAMNKRQIDMLEILTEIRRNQ